MPSPEQLKKLLQSQPDDLFLNFALAMELVKQGQSEEALTRFDRALEIDPTYAVAYFQKGTTLIAMGRKEEAQSVLEGGIAAAKKTGDTHAADKMQELVDAIA